MAITFFAFLLLILIGPSLWAAVVMWVHGRERLDFPGTGGEFARHILDQEKMAYIKVEQTDGWDHYDPIDKAVRLSPRHFQGRSVTAVAAAAHEVGHALQDRDGYLPYKSRLGLVHTENVLVSGMQMLSLLPVGVALLFASPAIAVISVLFLFFTLLIAFVMRLSSLHVEYDASFARAMPILESGYLPGRDLPAARQVLKAAALTYVSGALTVFLKLFVIRS